MSKLIRKLNGVWVEQSAWSKIWRRAGGVWSVIYSSAYYITTAGIPVPGFGANGSGIQWDVTQQADYRRYYAEGGGSRDEGYETSTFLAAISIDVTKYSYLCIEMDVVRCVSSNVQFGLWYNWNSQSAAIGNLHTAPTGRQIWRINISAYNGVMQVILSIATGNRSGRLAEVNVYNVWLE